MLNGLFRGKHALHHLGHAVHEGVVAGCRQPQLTGNGLCPITQLIPVVVKSGQSPHGIGIPVKTSPFGRGTIIHIFVGHPLIIPGLYKIRYIARFDDAVIWVVRPPILSHVSLANRWSRMARNTTSRWVSIRGRTLPTPRRSGSTR